MFLNDFRTSSKLLLSFGYLLKITKADPVDRLSSCLAEFHCFHAKTAKSRSLFITFMAINYGFSLVLKALFRKNDARSLLGMSVSKERTVAMLNVHDFISRTTQNTLVILTLLHIVSVLLSIL